jgi:hypothetical protein
MTTEFTKEQLLEAFDEIALAAIGAKTHLDIVVFGGSALMLASNFRYSTEELGVLGITPWRMQSQFSRNITRAAWQMPRRRAL